MHGTMCIKHSLIVLACTSAFTRAAVARAEPENGTPASLGGQAIPTEVDTSEQAPWWARLYVGGKLGPGLATLVGADADREVAKSTEKLAFLFGGFASIELNQWIAIHPEILFTFKGSETETNGSLNDTWDIRYIQVPILARVTVPTRTRITPYLLAGPTAGYLASLKIEDADDGTISDRKEDARAIDLGLLVGVGANVVLTPQHSLIIETRYDRGLRSIDKQDTLDIQNRVFSLMVGYQYSLSGRSSSGSPAVAEQAVNED